MKKILKGSELHNGLSEKEIRDYFSIAIYDIYQKELNMLNIKETGLIPNYDKNNPYDWSIAICKQTIKFEESKLKYLEQRRALSILIREKGWKEYDVSDFTLADANGGWLGFIGTDEEYDKLYEIFNS